MSLAVLIERQKAALAAGYKAGPDNGSREFPADGMRRYLHAGYEPADLIVFCPGCRASYKRGIQNWYAGWWAFRHRGDSGREEDLQWMRSHRQYNGDEHLVRIVEEPEGVPVEVTQ